MFLSSLCANAQVTANFTFAVDSNPCMIGLIHFTDQSTGNITSRIWDFGDGTTFNIQNPVHQYTSPGTYQVRLTVADSLGANDTSTQSVTVSFGMNVTINKTNPTCTCDGRAHASVTGGTPPYNFVWSTGTPVPIDSVINLCAGSVTVTVTDANSCSTTKSATLTSSVLLVNITQADASCNGSCDGFAQVSVSGGTPPYMYQWSNGMIAQTSTNLCAGTYTLIITDNNNCSTTASVTISEPSAMSVTLSVTNGTCATTGTVCANVSGGTFPVAYTWSIGATTACINVSQSGNYSITVTNANGCTAAGSISATGGLFSTVTDASCNCNGSINLGSPQPGTSILWSTGDTTLSIQNLCSGNYSVTVTDTSGTCIDSFIINQLPPLTLTVNSSSGNCISQTGYACITVTGGSWPYTYVWSNLTTASCQQNLPAGNYSVTVTDNNGCAATTSFSVVTNFLTVTDTSSNPTCGNTDGFISTSVTGGSGNYIYQWSPVSGSDSSLNGLPTGNYSVVITDSISGCSVTKNYTLYGSCGTVSGQVFNDANRNGVQNAGENGLPGIFVELNPGGFRALTNQSGDYTIGVAVFDTFSVQVDAPTRYACSGTAMVQDSVTFPAGNLHTVIVTQASPDATGIDFGITQPQQPCGMISGYVFDDVNQNGIDDGEPRKNGVVVRLSNGQSAVTDFFGMYSILVPFNVPVTVSITASPNSYFCGANQPLFVQTFPPFNGTYSVTLTPGVPNSMGNDFGVHASPFFDVMVVGIGAGGGNQAGRNFNVWMDYKAFGTSSLNCTLRLTFDPLVHFVSATYAPTTVTSTYIEWEYPFGTAPNWNCMGMTFYLDSSATAGTMLTWTGSYGCGTPDGCPGNNSVTRTVQVITGPLRQAQNNGLNMMEVIHTGTPADIITTNDSTFSYFIYFQNNTTDTAYHLTVVDTLSPHLNIETISTPFSSHAYELSIPASNILIWEFDRINLPDSTTNYLHSYGFIQFNIHMKPNLAPGTTIEQRAAISFNRSETVLTNTASVTVFEPLSVSADATDVTCFGGSDGAVDLTVSGGILPYNFLWNNGSTNKELQDVPAGNYSVVITDGNGFTTTVSATVAEGVDVNAGDISGADTARIDQIIPYAVNQVAGYSYSWTVTNGTIIAGHGTHNIQVDFGTAGQGTLSVTASAQGCSETVSKTVVLTEPTSIWSLDGEVVKIFPNPGSGLFAIEIPVSTKEDVKIKVYDLPGRMILEKIVSHHSARFELNIGEQTDGLYFVRVESGEKQYNGKVMLMR